MFLLEEVVVYPDDRQRLQTAVESVAKKMSVPLPPLSLEFYPLC